MNALHLAWIAPLSDSVSDKELNFTGELMIDGSRIAFLKEPLLADARFLQLQPPNDHLELWLLEFFSRSRFRKRFVVVVRELNANYIKANQDHGQAPDFKQIENRTFEEIERFGLLTCKEKERISHHILVFIKNADEQFEPARAVCSKWLRNSNTLGRERFERRSSHFLAVDGNGLALVVERTHHLSLFYRILVLFALAQGYMHAIDSAIKELADKCDRTEQLEDLYRDALMFNARSFFRYPVKLKRNEMAQVWEQIERRFLISAHNQELLDQLDAVRRLLDERASRMTAKRERRINYALGFLGVFIGLLSLGALIEITPEKVDSFMDGWSSWAQKHLFVEHSKSLREGR